MQKRFVSWAAVSSLPQAKKISLEDQLKTNREHIDRHEGELVAELVVPGISRSIILFEDAAARIEAYAQLRDLIKARAFDVLIYLDRSRLGRKASLIMTVVELCHDAGIQIYEIESPPASLDIPDFASHDEALIGAIKSVGAQQEIVKLQERHRKGMIGRTLKGNFPAAVPWGWTGTYVESATGKKILQSVELDPSAAITIRQILWDWFYVKGLGREQIAIELNAQGSHAPGGGTWSKANVQAIFLKRWRYAGFSEINRLGNRPYTIAKGNWPAIITEAEVRAIETEMERRVKARRSVSNTYLFSGCVWCATCGLRMIMSTHVRRRPTQRIQKSLVCRGDHDKRFISENKIRVAVRSAIKAAKRPKTRRAILSGENLDDRGILAQIEAIQAGIEKLRSSILRADDAYTRGDMDYDRYERQIKRIDGQIVEDRLKIDLLRKELDQLRHDSQRGVRLDELASQGLAMLEATDIKAANAWLRERIKVYVAEREVVRVHYL